MGCVSICVKLLHSGNPKECPDHSAENTAYVLSTLERFHAHNASPDHIFDLDPDKAEPPEGVM